MTEEALEKPRAVSGAVAREVLLIFWRSSSRYVESFCEVFWKLFEKTLWKISGEFSKELYSEKFFWTFEGFRSLSTVSPELLDNFRWTFGTLPVSILRNSRDFGGISKEIMGKFWKSFVVLFRKLVTNYWVTHFELQYLGIFQDYSRDDQEISDEI